MLATEHTSRRNACAVPLKIEGMRRKFRRGVNPVPIKNTEPVFLAALADEKPPATGLDVQFATEDDLPEPNSGVRAVFVRFFTMARTVFAPQFMRCRSVLRTRTQIQTTVYGARPSGFL